MDHNKILKWIQAIEFNEDDLSYGTIKTLCMIKTEIENDRKEKEKTQAQSKHDQSTPC